MKTIRSSNTAIIVNYTMPMYLLSSNNIFKTVFIFTKNKLKFIYVTKHVYIYILLSLYYVIIQLSYLELRPIIKVKNKNNTLSPIRFSSYSILRVYGLSG